MVWLMIVAAIGLLYPYVLYPLLLAIVSRVFERPHAPSPAGAPSIGILVSAFNEEHRIREKIANFQALDYPGDRLELWIGTDGTTDRTAQIVRELGDSRVHLVERAERSGKTAVLNDLAGRARTDLLVFTDVNALFRPDAVRRLATAVADPAVGLVSGRTVIRAGDGQVEVEGAYYRLESWLKAREGACGWLAGALTREFNLLLVIPLAASIGMSVITPGLMTLEETVGVNSTGDAAILEAFLHNSHAGSER